jgi:AraC-like DNA-binding protein
MLHIDAEWLDAIRAESIDVHDRCRATEPVRIAQDARTYNRFSTLNAKLFSEASVSEKEAALIEFIGDCDYETQLTLFPPAPTTTYNEELEMVLDFLRTEHNVVPTLAELAQLAGISRYQLIRLFRTFTGMTPHAWHLNQRINQARHYLHEGVPLAEVAYRLGFSDQSHFQRIFKAYAGATPGNYRS